MISINPKEVTTAEFHAAMLGVVAPRPIAFASTIDQTGNVNLSPFSFFNAFGANPPTLIFSPARRVRDNTTKHTLENVREVPEVVINIIDYSLVEQMSLSSTEYDKGVNEFVKAGLTEVSSERIAPPRVGEAPAAFECIVKDIIETGQEGGAGNLIICEVVLAHFKPSLFDANNKIDPYKLDAVARMGGNWYCRAQGDALFQVAKPLRTKGIGIDQLPEAVRLSTVLTGNELGKLGNVEQLPDATSISEWAKTQEFDGKTVADCHRLAQQYIKQGAIETALKLLLSKH